MKAQRKTGFGKGEMICGFCAHISLIYIIVGLVRESYLEFVAAQYDCNQCRRMAECKRNGQLPADYEWWGR